MVLKLLFVNAVAVILADHIKEYRFGFKYYNSYSKTLSGGNDEGGTPQTEYQTKSKIGLLLWFLRRNVFNIIPKLFLVALFIWLAFFGGGV